MDPQQGQQQNQQPIQDWRAGLPEDLRGEKSFEVIKGKDWAEAGPQMARQFLEAQKLIGGSVRIPKEDAKPEEISAFYAKLGRPESPDKYDLQPPMLPQGAGWDKEAEKAFRKLAHDIGLNNKQAQALVKFHGDSTLAAIQRAAETREADVSAIKAKYGASFGNRAALAEKAVYHLAQEAGIPMDKAKAFLESTGLGDHPVLFEMFGKLGESYLEDGFIRGDQPGFMSAEEARAKAQEENRKYIEDRSKGAPRDPDREAMIENLFKLAYGAK
jgi:hypothetical protein